MKKPFAGSCFWSKAHYGYDPYNSLDAWREWCGITEGLYLEL